MSDIMNNLRFIANSSRVVRWHTSIVNHRETLGEHHAMVSQLVLLLFPDCSKETLAYAITHDVGELLTGDIPSPVKNVLGIREQLSAIENGEGNPFAHEASNVSVEGYNQVLVCDVLARILYLWLERRTGNVHLTHKITAAFTLFDTLMVKHFPSEAVLFENLFEELFKDGLTYS